MVLCNYHSLILHSRQLLNVSAVHVDVHTFVPFVIQKMVGALNQSCYYGHLEAARLLLDKGADPNLQDYVSIVLSCAFLVICHFKL